MIRALFRRIAHLGYGSLALAGFAAVALPVVLATAVVPGVERRRRLVRRGAAACLALTATPIRVSGLDHLPPAGCVVVANHASYLDGIILTAVLPPRFAFVIKREMTQVPLAHFLLRRIGSLFVERFNRQRGTTDTRRILRRVREEALAFFPEGTFHREPGLRRFHQGAFAAAASGNVPVVPVVIRGSRAKLPAQALLPRPGHIDVVVLPPVPVPPEDAVPRLLATARARILAELGEPDLT